MLKAQKILCIIGMVLIVLMVGSFLMTFAIGKDIEKFIFFEGKQIDPKIIWSDRFFYLGVLALGLSSMNSIIFLIIDHLYSRRFLNLLKPSL